jgi:hypothetical protein
MLTSIIFGIVLSLLGFFYSIFTIKYSLRKKDWSDFNMFYWTSVIIKFSLLFILLLILLFLIEMDKIPLLLSFIISYLFFLFIEVLYLNKTKKF